MNNQACIAFCANAGYVYAGTEYSSECFCGNTIASAAAKVADTVCNMACSGNSTQPCGAGSRLSIFHTTEDLGPKTNPGVNGFVHMGCYTEGTTGRTLTYAANTIPNAEMTVAKCTAACLAANYILAGLEYGGECFCGNTISNGATPSTGCTMTCNGNSTEFCGAGGRLNVYNYQNQYSPATTSSGVVAATTSAATGTGTSAPVPTGPSQPEEVGNYNW